MSVQHDKMKDKSYDHESIPGIISILIGHEVETNNKSRSPNVGLFDLSGSFFFPDIGCVLKNDVRKSKNIIAFATHENEGLIIGVRVAIMIGTWEVCLVLISGSRGVSEVFIRVDRESSGGGSGNLGSRG